MKPKLFIVMEYPEDFPSEKYSIMRSQLQRRATEWSESKTDNVLMLMVPEGVKVGTERLVVHLVLGLKPMVEAVHRGLDGVKPADHAALP